MNSSLKRAAIIAVACATLGGAGFAIAQDDSNNVPGQESAGQYVASTGLTAKVKAALMANSDVKSLDISVSSYKDTVQLCGFVDDRTQISKAVALAKGVDGVKTVKNCLTIKH